MNIYINYTTKLKNNGYFRLCSKLKKMFEDTDTKEFTLRALQFHKDIDYLEYTPAKLLPDPEFEVGAVKEHHDKIDLRRGELYIPPEFQLSLDNPAKLRVRGDGRNSLLVFNEEHATLIDKIEMNIKKKMELDYFFPKLSK